MRDKQAGEITGIYQATSRGFGFVTPEDGKSREDDWFIPPRSDGGAWHGDQVCIQPLEEEGEGRRRSARVTVVQQDGHRHPVQTQPGAVAPAGQ